MGIAGNGTFGVTLLIVAGLLSAGCSSPEPGGSGAIDGASPDATVAAVPVEVAGFSVDLPPDLVDEAEVSVSPDPVKAGDRIDLDGLDVVAVTDTYSVEMVSELDDAVALHFDLEPGTDIEGLFVFWENGRGGWELLPSELDADRATISAYTDHFSGGFLGRFGDLTEAFRNYITGRSGVDHPGCGDEESLRDDYTVASDGGDTILWCAGRDDAGVFMRVANNRRMHIELLYPPEWTVDTKRDASLSDDAAIRLLGHSLSEFSDPNETRTRMMVSGGDTVQLRVPEGSHGLVTAEASINTWLISALWFGAQTYGTVAKAAKIGGDADFVSKLVVLANGDGPVKLADEIRSCFSGFRNNVPIVSQSETDPGAIFGFFFDCFPSVMKVYFDEYQDVSWLAAGILLKTVVTAVSFLLTGINLIVSGLREVWDLMASLGTDLGIGGNSDAYYDIRLASGGASPPVKQCGTESAFGVQFRLPSQGQWRPAQLGTDEPGINYVADPNGITSVGFRIRAGLLIDATLRETGADSTEIEIPGATRAVRYNIPFGDSGDGGGVGVLIEVDNKTVDATTYLYVEDQDQLGPDDLQEFIDSLCVDPTVVAQTELRDSTTGTDTEGGKEIVITDPDTHPRTGPEVVFYTPDDNIWCALWETSSICTIGEFTWELPDNYIKDCDNGLAAPDEYLDVFSVRVAVTADEASLTCASSWVGLTYGIATPTPVEIGDSITFAVTRCEILADGVECRHTKGPGVRLTRNRIDFS